uniref:Uncharacterized protein n=1 Tax=Anguilla anguilla TaxID=7936 RepID=A0A0E9UVF3_ANGAN
MPSCSLSLAVLRTVAQISSTSNVPLPRVVTGDLILMECILHC